MYAILVDWRTWLSQPCTYLGQRMWSHTWMADILWVGKVIGAGLQPLPVFGSDAMMLVIDQTQHSLSRIPTTIVLSICSRSVKALGRPRQVIADYQCSIFV